MAAESTLEELNTACVAAQKCLTFLGVIGADVESRIRRGEVEATRLAEANREWATELLENWRLLNAALKPHVQRDFTAVCGDPVEIGTVIAPNAHFAAWSVSHQALIILSIVMQSKGYWPSSQPETDLLLLDLDGIEVDDDSVSAAVQALGTVFDQSVLREMRNCRAVVYREFLAARAQLPPSAKLLGVVLADGKISDPNRRERNRLTFWIAIRKAHFDENGKCIHTKPYTNKDLKEKFGMTGNVSEMLRQHLCGLKEKFGVDDSKPRELYEWFCRTLLAENAEKAYDYVLQQLGEKPTGYLEKRASNYALDGRDPTWKERQAEADEKLDSESSD